MEEHRLKPMPESYDEALFNRLFEETKPLRIKLARGVNPDLYGLGYEDILSSFNVKFIFTFNKYYGSNITEGQLKGRIIQALKFFKCRILRFSQTHKNSVNKTIDITEFYNIESKEFIYEEPQREYSLDTLIPIFKKKLPYLAFLVFTIDYDPPLYIINKLDLDKINQKIGVKLILDYLGLENTPRNYNEILKARKSYKKIISELKVTK